MYKKLLIFTFLCVAVTPPPVIACTCVEKACSEVVVEKPKAKWTILLHVQACNNLESYAYKRFNEMMQEGSNSDVNVLIEFHKPGDTATRYKLEKNSCRNIETLPRHRSLDRKDTIKNELVDSVRWAKKLCPSERFGLIFWNHGYGVLDPKLNIIEPYYLRRPGTRSILSEGVVTTIPRAPSRASTHSIASDRGILFDEDRLTYLDNEGLYEAMKEMYNDPEIMNKQKIDFVGMDACNMGMVEVAYQMNGYAKTFTTSQEFEFGPGWAYGNILQELHKKPTMDGEQLGQTVVKTYKDYWHSRTGYYTQSNVNMDLVPLLKENMSQVARDILRCKKGDLESTRALIERARAQCLAFSMPDYIDVYSFYNQLLKLIEQAHDGIATVFLGGVKPMRVPAADVEQLKYSLRTGKELISKMVTANAAGRYLNKARGISVYFPQRGIDPSYMKTKFAQESDWIDMVHNHLTVKR